ncbi:cysteinyl-tRNA synthetase [Antricoccus suffuscus]|uniref:L-cysteine:1D-myo-inositol 2-amino-2-deoxy-alpha-D-glucopyranoside ligase n=1 Tax=Antricoccus suffuscus TaxID=1629062 RepID=A0A2T1A0M8_9ACTN|nr:cysteine--1-D-myo-inosityl 2-amino-2-deoxy-alpha-D-glucopyranoside ligase [Antricoccus suffuscus]PRZ42159.1 cysteinyl-tRNA synthetase [Antricoccus suffuscus]
MHSWPDVVVPPIPDNPPALRLYDSSSDTVRPLADRGEYRIYVCGITPYDATHLGHAATYLAFDLAIRQLRDAGKTVHYVQNVTDIDDPLLERAEANGEDWQDLARRETDLFREDMTALRVLPPERYVGAVESMDLVADAVNKLLESGAAYRLADGTNDVYYDTDAAPKFGYVSQYDEATMLGFFAERGGDPEREGKRHALDPLLWRGIRDGEPSWSTVVGEGRPGWHIECAAIALDGLGDTIDIQGGGSDLRFPHHEMSTAHAETLTGLTPFAGHYSQAAMIGLDGEKMSKSKGNLVLVSVLRRDGVDPMAVRVGLLAGHYRQDRDWSDEVLHAALDRLSAWRAAVARDNAPEAAPVIAAIRERLADDLDTPAALRIIDDWASTSGTAEGAGVQLSTAIDALLGIAL